ncbi:MULTISPECIES: hypothetical protein [Spongiibacter]|jgi:asparagine N-glycosylation enzyme membrane subunit Stt3|uniref:hypothetical protein n=1 Tax=Spongiibacter TaxID=630749 RepID=UPI000C093182|nr:MULTISPECIES: hypothetical protein [Spongiibacter]MAK45039.1 hypothetical protein [Spongiibacter sp.]MBM7422214.1 asparagine N-glycosylation enzyme membrane subunit Stt3 [Spongiibacter marinus]|tara:strand:+ start:32110 stop:32493 length:384 start_codon:yes stop_codon:yes gene_type:complete
MERSKLRSLRGLINISLLSLIFGAAIHILASLLGNYGAMALGAFGVLLTFYCYRRADREDASRLAYTLWRLLPTLTFVILPVAIFWYGSDSQWSATEVLMLVEISCSYLIPIACLLLVERSLKKAQQ